MNCIQNPDLINFIRRLKFLGLVRYEVAPKGRGKLQRKYVTMLTLKGGREGGGVFPSKVKRYFPPSLLEITHNSFFEK